MKLNLIPQPRQKKIFFVTADDLKALGAPSTTDPQQLSHLQSLVIRSYGLGLT
ncbi:MAG: hypothetical protein CM15mP17_00090 [Gammaproteobacteria bacterium]|nr:MAG: hypothetical protein CM15mP17_00090 [Gammaproteobacteria bacterium]